MWICFKAIFSAASWADDKVCARWRDLAFPFFFKSLQSLHLQVQNPTDEENLLSAPFWVSGPAPGAGLRGGKDELANPWSGGWTQCLSVQAKMLIKLPKNQFLFWIYSFKMVWFCFSSFFFLKLLDLVPLANPNLWKPHCLLHFALQNLE